MMMSFNRRVFSTALIFVLVVGCTTAHTPDRPTRLPSASAKLPTVQDLPQLLSDSENYRVIRQMLVEKLKKTPLSEENLNLLAERFARYFGFLKLSLVDTDHPQYKKAEQVFNRLLDSSTQFLICESLEDFDCLEAKPLMPPRAAYRQEDGEDLGTVRQLNENLDMESHFTRKWIPPSQPSKGGTMADALAGVIRRDWDSISMSLYGIDDVEDSMKGVFDALVSKSNVTRGVFDVNPTSTSDKRMRRENPQRYPDLSNLVTDAVAFQYAGTVALINRLNEGVKSSDAVRTRLESPVNNIMHNKFFVFKKGGQMSVWTGTTNVSRTCMGVEENSNLGVYIKNKPIAEVFQSEFEEMFAPMQKRGELTRRAPWLKTEVAMGGSMPEGHFHRNKRADTPRYFRFKDGLEMRIHFSPTDDGEHRSIVPMLLSARKGDHIRVAMFGCGGVEIVRAFQYAAALGATVQVIVDNLTCSGKTSWLWAPEGNLQEKNPYPDAKNQVEILVDNWSGLNHLKVGSLTRASGQAEYVVVGSQNWSSAGNDYNDENMISLRDKKRSLVLGDQFNEYFDEALWPNGKRPEAKGREAAGEEEPE